MRTRPALSWSDLAGARVGVWGLGIEGVPNLQRLLDLGADVVVVEDAPPPGPALGQPVLSLADGGLEALLTCDVVVKTPGVQRRRPEVVQLEEHGIPVVGGLGLWMQEAPRGRIAVITGTKGKSTTTAIAGHLLSALGYDCLVAGNMGRVPYEAGTSQAFDYAVVEVSSYQATDLAVSPPVVAVTSLHPDHLDWHGGVEEYYSDKLSVCRQPGAELTIADGDSDLLRQRSDGMGTHVRWVSQNDADLGGAWIDVLGLPGAHNRRNAMIARACLLGLGVPEASDAEQLAVAARGFQPLESRLRTIGVVAGVTFVDDSLSTNVLPTIAALEAFPDQRVALIVGGHDRGIDYGPLAEAIAARPAGRVLVVTLPDNGPRIAAAIQQLAGASTELSESTELEAAVKWAADWAKTEGGVVLLSPAAPSFGQFRNYRARAAAFAEAKDRWIRAAAPT